ncbi:MAG TPA: serine hydrolase, partial [Chitinophagales bacterium]|nr:serine hydrolase [Chitinophagales bacterium]
MKTNLLLLCLLCYCSSGYAQENLQPLVDKIVFSYVTAKANCGLAVAIVTEKGEQIFTYGETEKGNGIKPGAASLFETGEITSLFTTTLLSVASYEGTLDLNDEVQKYFPATIHIPVYEEIICAPIDEQHPVAAEQDRHTVYYCFADPSYHPKQMLLCDLATNTSGLPAYPDNLHKNPKTATPFDGYTLTDLYQFLNDYQSSYPTGLHYKFSPLGIAMLGNGL